MQAYCSISILVRISTEKAHLEMSSKRSQQVRQYVLEIFLNSVMHSQIKLGIFTCRQYFPQKQQLDFTFVDAGIGIPESVREYKNSVRL